VLSLLLNLLGFPLVGDMGRYDNLSLVMESSSGLVLELYDTCMSSYL